MKIIVIDIGGTNFRIGIFNEKNEVIDVHRFATPNFINHPHLKIEQLQELLLEILVNKINIYKEKYKNIKSVGLSFPAAITRDGVAHKVPTVWGKLGANYPLLSKIKSRVPNIEFLVVNDITAAAERYGQMEQYKSIDYLGIITVSSGIGNKIYDVQEGKVILDKMSIGGELGHVQYDLSKNAPICECGGKGHVACFSSGRAVEKNAQTWARKKKKEFAQSLLGKICKTPEKITNKEIAEFAQKKDIFTLDILDRATLPLAYSMSYLSGSIGVGKFIFIGGFALNLGEAYINSLKRNLEKIEFYSIEPNNVSDLAELGINDDSDCLIGVGLLSQKQSKGL